MGGWQGIDFNVQSRRHVSGIRTAVSTDGRQLFVAAPPVFPEPTRLYRAGSDRCFILDDDVEVAFVRDAQDDVTAMQVVATGQNVTAKKVK